MTLLAAIGCGMVGFAIWLEYQTWKSNGVKNDFTIKD